MNALNYVLYLILFALIIIASHRASIKSYFNSFKKFKCKRCGHCCRLLVRLSDEDIKRIEKNTKYKRKYFVEVKKKKNTLKKINNYCIFLNISKGKSKCIIYKHRPNICQKFPHFKRYGLKMSDSRCYAFDKKFK
ncbi:MAG: YkgJ family cysteine cluster protein [Nanoarchaeota archaeon]|nr:YkgJ family cysteine cluster protein [Nanoarchaeota archaeon]